jgi:hypothetical protein
MPLAPDVLPTALSKFAPSGSEFDAMLVAKEPLGAPISSNLAGRLAGSDGIQLDQLAELRWVGFPRSSSPA